MQEVQIRIAGFRYRPKGTKVYRLATRNSTLDLSGVNEDDVAKGLRSGAWSDPAEAQAALAAAEGDGKAPPADAPFGDVGQLAEWLKANPHNVKDTVALAAGDPTKAAQLAEAEPVATDGKPRATVLKGLATIMSSADGADPDAQAGSGDEGQGGAQE